MGLRARDALDDCNDAIEALEGGDRFNWKSHWIAAVTNLRAVGHILDKVDALESARHREVIDSHWEKILAEKQDAGSLFWDFIEPTRNNLLKEYEGLPECEVSVLGDDDVDIVVVTLRMDDGTDGLPMLREAVGWWEDGLDSIEAELEE